MLTMPVGQGQWTKGLEIRAIGLIALAEVLYEWNALALAEQALRFSIGLVQGAAQPRSEALLRGAATLARIYAARGDHDAGLALIDGAEERGEVCAAPMLQFVASQRARIWLARGDVERAAGLMQARWPHSGVEFSELQLLEHTTLARLLLAQGQVDAALLLLANLRRRAAEAGRKGDLIEVGVLEALAQQARGDSERALAALDGAIALGEPAGYVRSFLDAGEPLVTLLRRSTARGAARSATRAYAAWLLGQWGGDVDRAKDAASRQHPQLIEPLSARELGVLQLLLTGASNSDIARRLVITTGTVKRHIHSIYGKLNAHNRVELVTRVRELGLLTS
jgi:LuxR family maltose regulon positive regulatory protein